MLSKYAIARVCHDANRAYCIGLGDDSQPIWENAPRWQTSSALAGVEFHIANPEAGPEASHENWLKDKLADGWTWGPKKDEATKTHPCIMPFDQLPQEQQAKDKLFKAIVDALR